MDIQKVGNAIAYLRKRAGYTQKDLANRLGISDKAVSKWERGIGLPDITYFGKLAVLLDTDTDSLLAGDVIHHDSRWGGLLVLDENADGINAGTIIYDKPLVYFLLGYFLLVGIKDIVIVCDENSKKFIVSEFGRGEKLGISLSFDVKEYRHANYMVVFEKSIIYGVNQTRFFQRAMLHPDRFTILSLPRGMRSAQQGLFFDENRQLVDGHDRSQIATQYNYYPIPVFFCNAEQLKMLAEVKKPVMQSLACIGEIYTEVLDRGYVEMPINTWDDVLDASQFIRTVQNACGMQVYCLEEIAWRRGMIGTEELRAFAEVYKETARGEYLSNLIRGLE